MVRAPAPPSGPDVAHRRRSWSRSTPRGRLYTVLTSMFVFALGILAAGRRHQRRLGVAVTRG
ncbi:hypothetical protein [Dactylosporangium aurantiacum]|uniref:hypothetical protein n=1 Tax=Dactylosporangium aurantiacum TaxID=35754 RepID=UPI0012DE1315|nr:hypothetical protein [Dactylosporangium aurantiacum]